MAAPQKQFEVTKTTEEWKQSLPPEAFRVLREHGTERAGTSPLDKQYGKGKYDCAGCGQPLFTSNTKFDSTNANVVGFINFSHIQKNQMAMKIRLPRAVQLRSPVLLQQIMPFIGTH